MFTAERKGERNAELVEGMATIITAMGLKVATPTEARAMLGLRPL